MPQLVNVTSVFRSLNTAFTKNAGYDRTGGKKLYIVVYKSNLNQNNTGKLFL